ncbi:MAG TPA: LysE family transporter [Daejeonella sp.]|nr:LysE family transporter [Daejeonella sp.]
MFFLTFLVGLAVNFVGYIPFGNVNLTVVQLTINRSIRDAMYFIVSFSIVEFFFTYGIMYFADWFASHTHLMYWLDWILIVVFLVLGFASWRNTQKEKYVNYSHAESIKYGVLLGFLNPMQVPFWMIGGTYLISHEWIEVGNGALAIFSVGASVGSFLCLFGFARFSKYLHEKFAFSSRVINRSIAIIFFLLAAYHIIKMIIVHAR